MSVLLASQISPNDAWLTFLILSPAIPFQAPCSCHLNTPWLSCSPCSLSLKYSSTPFHRSKFRPSFQTQLNYHFVSFLHIFPHSTCLRRNTHSFLWIPIARWALSQHVTFCLSFFITRFWVLYLYSHYWLHSFWYEQLEPGEKGGTTRDMCYPFMSNTIPNGMPSSPVSQLIVPMTQRGGNQLLLEMGYDV